MTLCVHSGVCISLIMYRYFIFVPVHRVINSPRRIVKWTCQRALASVEEENKHMVIVCSRHRRAISQPILCCERPSILTRCCFQVICSTSPVTVGTWWWRSVRRWQSNGGIPVICRQRNGQQCTPAILNRLSFRFLLVTGGERGQRRDLIVLRRIKVCRMS